MGCALVWFEDQYPQPPPPPEAHEVHKEVIKANAAMMIVDLFIIIVF